MAEKNGQMATSNILEFAEAFFEAEASDNINENWKLILGIYSISVSKGKMFVPETFYPKIQKWFGTIDDHSVEDAVIRVENQIVVRIVNRWTFDQTLFNPIRSKRPMNNTMEVKTTTEVADELQLIPEKCDFCSPISYTAIDSWGRIERNTAMTASNCAKYDALHSLIIFKDHQPLKYSKEKLTDIFSICEEWFQCANDSNGNAIFPMFSWNCKGRAGASQNHGHAHLLLAENFHYGRYEYLQNVANNYNFAKPNRNYFLDLITTSKAMGLAKSIGESTILVNLTPSFGYDLIVISWNFDKEFRDAMDCAFNLLVKKFESVTFNIGILFPPLEKGKIRKRLPWTHLKDRLLLDDAPMPYIAYLVDRGDPSNGKYTSDVCGMKLFGSNIVARDPFEIGKILRIPDVLWK